ncbi:steroid 17alpha-monooxygenase or 17alpha-hydroxyprogesterone aldolase [Spatholobus suberectus]|nr:steroid 17alpha-monooxygenase or 17alpha-hydroxyprogesterone aldolase [Spatholobus suberectus]
METWLAVTILCLCLSVILKAIRNVLFPLSPLPPGPPKCNFRLLRRYLTDPKTILQKLHVKYGPIFTLHVGYSHTDIFIANRFVAHQALIQHGTIFADRPKANPTNEIISSNQHDILFSFYGPTWRLLRRNLTSRILHPSQVKSYAHARKWVLDNILLQRLKSDSDASNPVRVIDHFQYGMFSLLVLMCLGDKLDEKQIRAIEDSQRHMLVSFARYSVLNFWPPITRILFWKRWKEFLQLRREQEAVLIPHINARRKAKVERVSNGSSQSSEFVLSYVDTLLDLQMLEDEEGSKLDDGKICTLCSEFLNAGSDTTSTALEWIMANLVKYHDIQERVVEEIRGVMVGREDREVKEEDLHKLPYLKAVILEGLRRHPPLHFVAPHRVTKDVVLNGYLVPTYASVNFLVAEIGRDPTAWDDPMAFKPERFMNNGDQNGGTTFDIMGSKEIKMMPFGAGRRMCPGYALAMLHLEYFVANFVSNFEWKAVEGDEVDLSEKLQFTTVMKNPLKVHILPRQ